MSANKRAKEDAPPVAYSERIANKILDALAQAIPLARVCREKGMPTDRTVRGWLVKVPGFAQRYDIARTAGMDYVAWEARQILDGIPAKQAACKTHMEAIWTMRCETIRARKRIDVLKYWQPKIHAPGK